MYPKLTNVKFASGTSRAGASSVQHRPNRWTGCWSSRHCDFVHLRHSHVVWPSQEVEEKEATKEREERAAREGLWHNNVCQFFFETIFILRRQTFFQLEKAKAARAAAAQAAIAKGASTSQDFPNINNSNAVRTAWYSRNQTAPLQYPPV